ncbi:MAG: glycoside hydrolase family 13 protein [Thermoleophilia bacterium]|nr:glycoside hydrolase family 13 protein [Thermoleophilia bacterium]
MLAQPHHDGSARYVLERPPELGGEAVVRLRVPSGTAVDHVVLRSFVDGEIRVAEAEVDEEGDGETWWSASFEVGNPVTPYRWLLAGGDVGYAWVNGLGVVRHDVPDADDFVMTPGDGGPEWHLRSVVYEIFSDRFASSGAGGEPPPWAKPMEWGSRPTGRGWQNQFDFYGGDLRGIEQHLDHVERLGVGAIYLTPFFPAGSTHRYDASSFDRVDPLLGGDEALRSLARASHERGIRVIGDLTLNHSGAGHEWFTRSSGDEAAPERSYYFFDSSLPDGYASWLGVRTLPKLNWASAELRAAALAVVRRWAEEGLDGWRIDVANQAGRYRGADLTHELARAVREVLVATRGDGVLIAEHAHDFRRDLRGDGWHGTMNYAGFLRPVWAWLRRGELSPDLREHFWGFPVGLHRFDGGQVAATMRAFRAGVPWDGTLHSWVLLDSHDTARFSTVAGSRARQLVGVGLQMTTPGVPMVFAGDELGLQGEWGEDARRTMPWDAPETWDEELLAAYGRLIALRRSSEALAHGGIRYAFVDGDVIAYLRETGKERLLCLASRAPHEPVRLPLQALGCRALETLEGAEAHAADGLVTLPADGPAFHIWRIV